MKRRVLQPAPAMYGVIAGDAVAVIGGLALYLAFLFWLHTWLIGVPVLTRG